MPNGSARMIGAVGVILAGAVMYGLGLVAYYTPGGGSTADHCAARASGSSASGRCCS